MASPIGVWYMRPELPRCRPFLVFLEILTSVSFLMALRASHSRLKLEFIRVLGVRMISLYGAWFG